MKDAKTSAGRHVRVGIVLAVAVALAGLTRAASPATRLGPPAGQEPRCPAATPTSGAAPPGLVLGYAGLSGEFPFVQDVNRGLERAAACLGIELFVADNGYDPRRAIAAADALADRGVDVAIEFQTDVEVAATLCDAFGAAGVPVIAIDVPHPCAVSFGADNPAAGRIAGDNLARVAMGRWGGDVDALVALEAPERSLLPGLGPLAQQRIDGAIAAAQAALPSLTDEKIIRIDGKGSLDESRRVMADVLTRLGDAEHILVAAVNDPSAVGALRAVEQADRADDVLIAGQHATIEARDELCRRSESFIGSVAHFPDRYGDKLIPLAIDLANGVEPPAAVVVDHRWIDATNVGQFYPGECP